MTEVQKIYKKLPATTYWCITDLDDVFEPRKCYGAAQSFFIYHMDNYATLAEFVVHENKI